MITQLSGLQAATRRQQAAVEQDTVHCTEQTEAAIKCANEKNDQVPLDGLQVLLMVTLKNGVIIGVKEYTQVG